MDRNIVYPGQIPLETDLLGTNQRAMVALGKLSAAIFGTGGVVNGLSVAANTPAALNVVVSPGEIYQLQNLEATPFSSLPADTVHPCVKQGILLDAVTLACPPPTTAGFSTNYLIEATYVENDIGATTLPYYNASNPSQAYSGPNNTGLQQATVRAGQVQLQVKAGVAAATGTQTTPVVDAGYIALAVVTVANGQTSITAANIVAGTSSQLLRNPVAYGRLLNVQVFNTAGTFPYNSSPGTKGVIPYVQGGGGAGGSCSSPTASQAAAACGGAAGALGVGLITSGFNGVAVTVGAGGSPGAAGAVAGGNGGLSSFGSLITAPGGGGGSGGGGAIPPGINNGVGGSGMASGGSISNGRGMPGGSGFAFATTVVLSGAGGASAYGGGGSPVSNTSGNPGTSPGSGGSGASVVASGAAQQGGAGATGLVAVFEFG